MKNRLYLGADIGGTAVKFGLVDELGNIYAKEEFSVSFDGYETPILNTVLEKSEVFLKSNSYSFAEISGIGISATGQIDSERGIVAGSAGHIKNWLGVRIKDSFEMKYGIRAEVINDANSVALGEKWVGAGKSAKDIVAITIGTGVGGGIIVNNKILSGQRGLAGEIGHIVIHSDGERCSCGGRGCLERYGSMSALIRRARARIESCPEDFGTDLREHINGRMIFDELEKGNQTIKELVDEWLSDISQGIVSLIHIFNPEMVIIGGGVSSRRYFCKNIEKKVFENIMPRFGDNLKIVPASLGNDAGLVGAVYYFMSKA